MGLEDDIKFSLEMAICIYVLASMSGVSAKKRNRRNGARGAVLQERSRTSGSPQFCVLDLGLQAGSGIKRKGCP